MAAQRLLPIFILIFCLVSIPVPLQAQSESPGSFDCVPHDATLIGYIDDYRQDLGISYILGLLKSKLDQKEKKQKKEQISYLFRELYPDSVTAFAYFKDEEIKDYALILEVSGLIEGQSKLAALAESLEILIKKVKDLKKQVYHNYQIVYSSDRYAEDISCYALLDAKRVALGSNLEVLKRVLLTKQGTLGSINDDQVFNKIRGYLLDTQDGFVFVNNRDKIFSQALKKWESSHITVLLFSENLAGIGLSFDLANNDSMLGRVIFLGSSSDISLTEIEEDAYFFDEAINRKLAAEGLSYEGEISKDSASVILDFKGYGFKSLWKKVFEKKDVFKQSRDDEPAVCPAGHNYFKMILLPLLILAVIFIVISKKTNKN